jgi:hypothetical protein
MTVSDLLEQPYHKSDNDIKLVTSCESPLLASEPARLSWSLGTRLAKHAVNMTFCGPERDMVLTNRQTEKLNFDTNYITLWLYELITWLAIRSVR